MAKYIYFFSLAFCLSITKTYSQIEEYELKPKDYHSSQITQMVVTKDNQALITTDESGKIIAWNTSDFSYVKTLKKGEGYPIQDMRLAFQGKGLILKKNDTLWTIDLKGKVLSKTKLKVKIINRKNDPSAIVYISKNDKTLTSEVLISDTQFKSIKSFIIKNRVPISRINDIASISQQGNQIALAVENFKDKSYQYLVYRDLQKNETLWETSVNDTHKIAHLFFNTEGTKLYAVTISEDEKLLSVYEYVNGKRKTIPEVTIPYRYSIRSAGFTDYFVEDSKIIVSTKSNFKQQPILISARNGKFSAEKINIPNGAYTTMYLPNKKQLISADIFQKNYKDIASFSVYSLDKKKYNNSYPNFSQEFYSGVFLPDNSWLVYGNNKKQKKEVKHYEKGTFYNRFHTLNLDDYIEVNHKVNKHPSSFELFRDKGVLLFHDYPNKSSKRSFYKYNFKDDAITKLVEVKNDFFEILDYNEDNDKLLVSPKKYYNNGYTDAQPIRIIKKGNSSKIKGNYKFAKFSKDGSRILTINENNLVQIRNLKLKILFEQQLKKGSYHIFAPDKANFIVSCSYGVINFDKCNKETIAFLSQPNNTYKTDKKDCVLLTNITYKNEKTVMLFDGAGLLINNKLIRFSNTEMPKSISLNNNGSKLMVSYANGKIGILDTASLEELGGSFHPSVKEHIFYGNNHYFSNTDASDFLMVTKDDKKTTLQEADKILFKPNKVLPIFSTPNQEYVALLEKAIKLRTNRKKFNNIKILQSKSKPKPTKTNIEKGDLYVLSIGVSDYEQSNYNLTFADKDAFDIANLYGKLDDETVQKFNTKFLGDKYTLTSTTGKNQGTLKKYKEIYGSVGNLHPIDSQGNIWIEIDPNNKEEPNIWNYSTKKHTPIRLPEDFKWDTFDIGKKIYTSINDKAFFLRTKENIFYKYLLNSNTFEKIELPFKIDYNLENNNIHPISNNRWIYFKKESDGLDEKVKLFINESKSSKMDSITINVNYFKNPINGNIEEANIYNPNFNDISSNGKYVLFNASENDAYFFNVENDTIPTKLPIKINHLDEASISENGTKFTVLKTSLDNDYRYKFISYSTNEKVIDTSTYLDKKHNIKGISILNADPKLITQSESLVDRINYSYKVNKKLLKTHSSSFKNVKIKYLTNDEANKENIEKNLTSFFSQANANDQIVLFLAGHGTLDTQNNYYYAPYNMYFNNVSKNGVHFKTIIEGLAKSKATQKLLLMDTCHSGNTLDMVTNNKSSTSESHKNGQRGSVSTSRKKNIKFKLSNMVSSLFDDFLSTSGVTILSASSGEDVAYENKKLGNGAFTTAYLKVLHARMQQLNFNVSNDKVITLDDDFIKQVMKEVIQITNGKQVPDLREVNEDIKIKVW